MCIGIDKLNSMLDTKINVLEIKLNHVISRQNQKIKLLEQKCERYEEDNETLKSIVSKQQTKNNKERLVTLIENNRERNDIISGMAEEDLMKDKDVQYENDEQKTSTLFKLIGIYLPSRY